MKKRLPTILIILSGFLVLFLIHHFWLKNDAYIHPKPKDTDNNQTSLLMPEPYKYVYLGMPKKELKRINPKLSWDDSNKSYYEEVDKKFYNLVNFDFSLMGTIKDTDVLIGVSFYNEFDKEYNNEYLKDFLNYCIKKWGKNYEIRLYTCEGVHYLFPLLYWHKIDADIQVFYKHKSPMKRTKIAIYNPRLSYSSTILKECTRPCTKKEIETYLKNILK